MTEDRKKELERMIEVVVRAIPKERDAQNLYRATARSATMEMTRKLFEKLADDEAMHEQKLRAVKELLEKEL